MSSLNFVHNETKQSLMLVLNKEPLMAHVGGFVDKCMLANHPSTQVLVVAPDDDKRKSAIRVASIEQSDCLRTFAARVLASTSVPFGYCPHNSVKSSNGNIDVSRTVQRWNSLFKVLHAQLKLPLTDDISKFVAQFKRINSRVKRRAHPFDRAWDSLERCKKIFNLVATLLMDNYCVWRRKPTSQQHCSNKMKEFGLTSMVGQFPETSVRIISVLWDTVVMLRWIIHMVKNVRIDRSPKDFDPKTNAKQTTEQTLAIVPMDIELTKDQIQWLAELNADDITYYRWCEYTIAFCSTMGDDQQTLKALPFYQRNVYLGTMLRALRPYFYTWLQKNQTNDDHLGPVATLTRKIVKNFNRLPETLPNMPVTSTIKSLLAHPSMVQWINNTTPFNPYTVAPPSTWASLHKLLAVYKSTPNVSGEEEPHHNSMVAYTRLKKLCLLLDNMDQQFSGLDNVE
uniref:Uncharacterized protein n=1 Tax=Clandestinovirus TaxID=2831644 RepID=A0A8F8KTB0_9VIRU|nr:hypothetical protein KOM_12_407 [Clandestinovirus]